MAKKTSPTKALEQAQKNAAKSLIDTRRKIREQAEVTSYEYCLLHEDSTAEAKKAAELIDRLMSEVASQTGPTPILICEGDKYTYAIMDRAMLVLLPNGNWKFAYQKLTSWNDSKLLMLQTEEVIGPEIMKHGTPLHHFLRGGDRLVVVGEKNVADRLITIADKSKGNGSPPHYDRFNFFYILTKKLGYELTEKKLKERIKEERERVAQDCERHLTTLTGLFDEFFVHGARDLPVGRTTSDGSAVLVRRAQDHAQQMRRTLSECKLYGIDTEASREVAAFGKRWIKFFDLGRD